VYPTQPQDQTKYTNIYQPTQPTQQQRISDAMARLSQAGQAGAFDYRYGAARPEAGPLDWSQWGIQQVMPVAQAGMNIAGGGNVLGNLLGVGAGALGGLSKQSEFGRSPAGSILGQAGVGALAGAGSALLQGGGLAATLGGMFGGAAGSVAQPSQMLTLGLGGKGSEYVGYASTAASTVTLGIKAVDALGKVFGLGEKVVSQALGSVLGSLGPVLGIVGKLLGHPGFNFLLTCVVNIITGIVEQFQRPSRREAKEEALNFFLGRVANHVKSRLTEEAMRQGQEPFAGTFGEWAPEGKAPTTGYIPEDVRSGELMASRYWSGIGGTKGYDPYAGISQYEITPETQLVTDEYFAGWDPETREALFTSDPAKAVEFDNYDQGTRAIGDVAEKRWYQQGEAVRPTGEVVLPTGEAALSRTIGIRSALGSSPHITYGLDPTDLGWDYNARLAQLRDLGYATDYTSPLWTQEAHGDLSLEIERDPNTGALKMVKRSATPEMQAMAQMTRVEGPQEKWAREGPGEGGYTVPQDVVDPTTGQSISPYWAPFHKAQELKEKLLAPIEDLTLYKPEQQATLMRFEQLVPFALNSLAGGRGGQIAQMVMNSLKERMPSIFGDVTADNPYINFAKSYAIYKMMESVWERQRTGFKFRQSDVDPALFGGEPGGSE
jgi:hypothetical protein